MDDPDSLITDLGELMKDGGTIGFDQSQKQFMRNRIEILRAVVQQGKSIQYLGEIKYAEDFERARSELGLTPRS